jgi:phosphoglycerate dehydrogenase-like enzyme
MRHVLVLDANTDEYRELFAGYQSANIEFSYSNNPLTEVQCDYLLARPDYAAQYLKGKGQDNVPCWIQSCWAGVESLVTQLSYYPTTKLTGLKGFFGPLIAEYTFNYLLEDQRRSSTFKEQQLNKLWKDDPRPLGTLGGKTIAILGTGSIGRHVAKIAKAFNMNVTGLSRREKIFLENFDLLSLNVDEVVKEADYILACLPDTTSTKNLICKKTFNAMKKTSTIINVGRGASVNIPDLLNALRSGQISKAILDVFPNEPLLPDDPLWQEPNLLITPHIAAISAPSNVAVTFLENLKHIEAGENLSNIVDIKQGY